MARLFARWPAALERTVEVAERIGFDLSQLQVRIPRRAGSAGQDGHEHLTDLAWEGAAWRYPGGVPEKVQRAPAPGARPDRGAGLSQLFPHRPRHRRLGEGPGHPLPGTRIGGQFGGLLLPGGHGGRSHPAQSRRALRPLHLQGARRAARHRRRLRARAARAGHAVRLRALRPRAGGDLRHRHPLSPAQRHPRRRQGAGPDRGHHRRPGRHGVGKLGRGPSRRPHPPGGPGSGQSRRSAARRPWPTNSWAFPATSRSTSAASCSPSGGWTRPCRSATPP